MGRRGRGGHEGVEREEGELGFREEGRGLAVVGGGVGLAELVEDGPEVGFGRHGDGWMERFVWRLGLCLGVLG